MFGFHEAIFRLCIKRAVTYNWKRLKLRDLVYIY
jgi:hypothetical protein